MRRLIACILAVSALAYYGWRFFSSPRVETPEELARTALTAGAADEREVAAVKLSQLGKPAREHFLHVLDESGQPEVRAACIRGLAEQWSYRDMPVLLRALEDDSVTVRAQAGQAVQLMLRINYEFRADDPEEKRQEVVKRLYKRWEVFQRLPTGILYMRQQQGEPL
jgi:hypothetical protein